MLSRLSAMPMDCDAPSYPIVAACAKLGFRAPLDVRWCRVVPPGPTVGWLTTVCRRAWHWLLESDPPAGGICNCGAALPYLERCRFIGLAVSAHYLIGQCRRCSTMFWTEVDAEP
jgi:hypothetical protein